MLSFTTRLIVQRFFILVFLIGGLSSTVEAQSEAVDTSNWLENYNDILHEEFVCKPQDPLNDRSPCNYFISNVFIKGWGLNDFKTSGGHISANQIFDFVDQSDNWTKIGSADNQAALELAQDYANDGLPVLAVSKGVSHGHVALIIPGRLMRSGAWAMNVPNTASFFLDKPHKSFVGKTLSFAWKPESKSEVNLYFRSLEQGPLSADRQIIRGAYLAAQEALFFKGNKVQYCVWQGFVPIKSSHPLIPNFFPARYNSLNKALRYLPAMHVLGGQKVDVKICIDGTDCTCIDRKECKQGDLDVSGQLFKRTSWAEVLKAAAKFGVTCGKF